MWKASYSYASSIFNTVFHSCVKRVLDLWLVMGMAALIFSNNPHLLCLVVCYWSLFIPALAQNLLGCDTASPDASGYRCNGNKLQDQCKTFAVLHPNSYYSSLSNLSNYLGLNPKVIAEANGLSAETELLMKDQLLLIPIECRCDEGYFQAELMKTSIKGETFLSIAEALEGLTTCRAIQVKNPSVSQWGLVEGIHLHIPVRCACPSPSEVSHGMELLLSYPVISGEDTVAYLAAKFKTSSEAILSTNQRSAATFQTGKLIQGLSVLIPLQDKLVLSQLRQTNSSFLAKKHSHKKHSKKLKIGISVALCAFAIGASIASAAVFFTIQGKKRKDSSGKMGDMELQQLGLSARTTSDKKVSFEGSQMTLDSQIMGTTPRKHLVETYTLLELRKATEDFSSTNRIGGEVFHGRLNGKSLAIKHVQPEIVTKIEFGLFQDAIHHHPNIVRLYGTCLTEGPADMYLVLDYAKNGSLKDWLHGGLAIKSQFIASCYCFLTWSQRVRICLDIASALQFMHHTMSPSYVHGNIKSQNILVDEDFSAKVGKFGMAKCIQDNEIGQELKSGDHSEAVSVSSWSIGYLAPEYLREGIVAPSIDIFAYGVVLVEVLCGQAPISSDVKGEGIVCLSEKIKSILQSDNVQELREWMDGALGENYSFDGAVALATLAKACVEEEPSSRPSAGELVEKLSRLVEELPQTESILGSESLVKAAPDDCE